VLVVALVACAWFALSAQQAVDLSRATALIDTDAVVHTSQARQARALLDSAATLNPDLTVIQLRGQLEYNRRQYRAAERTFASLTRREPLNLEAWTLLAFAAYKAGDRATVTRAGHHVSMLYRS
jgi:predicted Zn-dependent protease